MNIIIWRKRILFFLLVLILSINGTSLPIFAVEAHEIYTFKVDSNIYECQIDGKTNTSDFVHPIIIKEDRAMLDSRFFNTQFSPIVIALSFEFSGIPNTNRCHHYLYDKINKNEIEMEILVTFYPNSEIVKECKISEDILFNGTEKLKFPVMPIYKGNESIQRIYLSSMNSHLLLPLRFIFELFGYTVEWNNDTREITVYK